MAEFPPQRRSNVGLWLNRIVGLFVLVFGAYFQLVAFDVHLRDVDVMRQPVEECAYKALRSKCVCPFIDWQKKQRGLSNHRSWVLEHPKFGLH